MDRTTLALLFVAVLLGATVYLERTEGLFAPAPIPQIALAGHAAPDARDEARIDARREKDPGARSGGRWSASEFDAIVERPLFSPTRRPVERAAPQPEARSPLDRLKLVASVEDGARRIALLQDAAGRAYHRVAQGDALFGWRLAAVDAQAARFEKGAATRIVDRDGARAAPAPE